MSVVVRVRVRVVRCGLVKSEEKQLVMKGRK